MQNEDVRSRFAAFPSLASLEATPRSLSGDVLLVDRGRDVQLGRLVQLARHVLQATTRQPLREAQLQRLAELVSTHPIKLVARERSGTQEACVLNLLRCSVGIVGLLS